MNKIIDGKLLQQDFKKELQKKVDVIKDKLKLVVIQVDNNLSSDIYVKTKVKLCQEMGILFEYKKFDYILEDELILEIEKLNNDLSVTGILVELPLPEYINQNRVIEAISFYKDVDGLTSYNVGRLSNGIDGIIPCTALSIINILDKINMNLSGINVVIVGKSRLVGMPLIKLLLDKSATVISCNSKTKNLKKLTSLADVLIVAIGEKEFIDDTYIKRGAVVIDVGVNVINNKIYGDCDFEKMIEKCSYITPPVGGVGPLTNVMVINNLICLYNLQNNDLK